MAQAPPTQKFRLHPIRQTTSSLSGSEKNEVNMESKEKTEQPAGTACENSVSSTSELPRTENIISSDLTDRKVTKRHGSSSSAPTKDRGLRNMSRSGELYSYFY